MIERIRPDGFILRPGRPADRQSLLDLIELRHDASDVPEAALVFDDPDFGPAGWLVAHDRTRVVACIAPFPHRLRLGARPVPALEIEFVTSHPDVGRRGLVRDLFEIVPEIYPEHVAHLMIGIPYFYRRLGYEYAIPVPRERLIGPDDPVVMPGGWQFEVCVSDDIERIVAAQEATAGLVDVAFSHTDAKWRWFMQSPNYTTVRVWNFEQEGYARIHRWEGNAYVFDLAIPTDEATDAGHDAIRAIAAAARNLTGGEISLLERPGIEPVLAGFGEASSMDYAYYARITNPVRFLNLIRPVLSARLAAAGIPGPPEPLVLSLYATSVTIPFDGFEVAEITPGPPIQAPVAAGGAGVPPDHFAELVLGPAGFAALQSRYPDVRAAPTVATLLNTLFPAQTVDVQTWVYP